MGRAGGPVAGSAGGTVPHGQSADGSDSGPGADAERELGTPLLGELCTIREGAERVKLDFEATFDPLAPKEAGGP